MVKSVAALIDAGLADPQDRQRLNAVAERYAIAITPTMLGQMPRGLGDDPVARQFVPDVRELETTRDERADPIGDGVHEVLPGVVHRYRDRVLFKVTHACPVYCRFCFRREMVGPGGVSMLTGDRLAQAIDYVARNSGIFEVILTGGDPLMIAPERIAALTSALSAIPHVGSVRWHTRVPVVAPERVTDSMIEALRSEGGPAVTIGIHTNHVQEWTSAAEAAVGRMIDRGLVAMSQTVLLKGINADADVLEALFRKLVRMRVRPYYLHHPDMAPGTAHFRLTIDEGRAIFGQLRGRLSGLALPTYVLDIPGGVAKVPIGPNYVGATTVEDPWGGVHPRPDRPQPLP